VLVVDCSHSNNYTHITVASDSYSTNIRSHRCSITPSLLASVAPDNVACGNPAAEAEAGGMAVARKLRGRPQLGLSLLGSQKAARGQWHGHDASMEASHARVAAAVQQGS